MARNRTKAASKTETQKVNTNGNTNEGVRKMAGLTAEQIAALLGKTRQKGVYIQYLNQFLDGGESGICVNETWVDLKDKKASTLKQGFENAKENKEAKDGSEFVKVIANEDKVYLINLQAAGIETEAETADVA
jgi:hypothetical protein